MNKRAFLLLDILLWVQVILGFIGLVFYDFTIK